MSNRDKYCTAQTFPLKLSHALRTVNCMFANLCNHSRSTQHHINQLSALCTQLMLELSGHEPACELSLLPFPQCSETAPEKPNGQCQPIKETFSVVSPDILTSILCSTLTGVASTVTYHLTLTEHSIQTACPSFLIGTPHSKPTRLHCNAECPTQSALHNTLRLTTCIQTHNIKVSSHSCWLWACTMTCLQNMVHAMQDTYRLGAWRGFLELLCMLGDEASVHNALLEVLNVQDHGMVLNGGGYA